MPLAATEAKTCSLSHLHHGVSHCTLCFNHFVKDWCINFALIMSVLNAFDATTGWYSWMCETLILWPGLVITVRRTTALFTDQWTK